MSETEVFDRLLASLHRAALDDAYWSTTAALVDEAIGVEGNALVFSAGRSTDDGRVLFSRLMFRGERNEELEREYFRVYHPVDERIPRVRRLPASRIVPVARLYTEEELRTSIVYNEELPRGLAQNSLNVRLDGPNGSHIVWSIKDPVVADGWPVARVEKIRRLLPHLRHYVSVRHVLAESNAMGASMSGLMERTGIGFIQLDGRGRVLAANDRAQNLLREGDGLFDRDGFLCARRSDADAALQGLLARALPRFGERGAGGSMRVGRPAGRLGLVLHVAPVVHGLVNLGASRVAALVLVVDPDARARVDPELVEATLGLKPRESRVAALLAEGRNVSEIAALTRRSENTVRWYLKQIYWKCEISRQVDLVRLVLSVAGPPGPRD